MAEAARREPLRITMVCLGNICRSPIGAAVLRARFDEAGLDGAVEVDSAGTAGYHSGEGADPRTVAALQRHRYPTAHTARRIKVADLERADLVLAADQANVRDLWRLSRTDDQRARIHLLRSFDVDAPVGAEVPDPWYGGDEDFDEVVALIEAAAPGVVAWAEERLAER